MGIKGWQVLMYVRSGVLLKPGDAQAPYSFTCSGAAGRERPDGNDETVLEGQKEDSCFPNGFWHPYGRGANIPPTRVVCLAPEAVAQVTLKLPDHDAIAAAQVNHQGT